MTVEETQNDIQQDGDALTANEVAQEGPAAPGGRVKGKSKRVALVVSGVVVLAIVVVTCLFYTGVLSPTNAAAKYGAFSYISEDEVTEYIDLYRNQMGYGDATDEEWAAFLAAYNLTPERLRMSTIYQLACDSLIEKKVKDLGIVVEDEEVQAMVEALKNNMALGDDELWANVLNTYGQSEEQVADVYRKALCKQKVLEQEVPTPTPTENEVREYMLTYDSTLEDPLVKHSYCLKMAVEEDADSLEVAQRVKEARDSFAESPNADTFYALSQYYCTDDELKEKGGANGWNCDMTGYSDTYLTQLSSLGEGDISGVFAEDDGSYVFIWVDATYELPTDSTEILNLDFAPMPDSLYEYLSDKAAVGLWEEDCQEYLSQLVEDSDIVYYPMPTGLPYDVDMALAEESADSDEDDPTDDVAGQDNETPSGESAS